MKKIIFTIAILMIGTTIVNAQELEYNGGEKVEYVGLYSYKNNNGQTVFKNATADWNSMQEFKKAKEMYGFRLESASNSTIHKQNKLEKDRKSNVEGRVNDLNK